ncbi:MAG: DnaJ domain-containing protein [Alphaproteobacteria bacterium]|nr:DnaJ domain-containing protein [Rhodospirillales bacterium]MCW9046042.1 DnaJ domain-containing protein [Alphaproteobacteria bacterium]
MKNPYQILGVSAKADQDDIKSSYRKLARKYHPDRNAGDKSFEDRFKEISVAYDFLSDPLKRKRFDNGEIDSAGNVIRKKNAPKNETFKKFWAKRKTVKEKPKKGANVTYAFKIDSDEAAIGSTKRVSMANGKRLEIKIPPGTTDGQVLRLKGQGSEGLSGGASGDALIEIEVTPSERFTVEDGDVYLDATVPLKTAVLGGKLQVDTLKGPVSVDVPRYVNTGAKLRLKGKGAKKDDGTRGDQYITLRIALPTPQDDDLIALFERQDGKKSSHKRKKVKL